MRKLWLAAICCAWALSCYAQTTAVRPPQIIGGTPDITSTVVGNNLQIGSTVPWRTDATTTPAFTSADAGMVVELTNGGALSSTLPAATGAMGDGFAFTIQVAAGTLTLGHTGTSYISGQTQIVIGPYQTTTLLSRGGIWYAATSVAQAAGAGPAIAFNTSAVVGSVSTGTLTQPYTMGSGTNRLLLIGVTGGVSSAAYNIGTVTYGGVNMTMATNVQIPNQRWIGLYYLLNPASGSNSVVVPGGSDYAIVTGADYTGVTGFGQATTAQQTPTTSTTITGSITPAVPSWVMMLCGVATAQSQVAGAGATQRINFTSGGGLNLSSQYDSNSVAASGAAYNMTVNYTTTAAPSAMILATFH